MITRRDLLDQAGPSAAAAGAVVLTSFALAPTLGEGPWFMSTLVVVATVAVVGTVLRALRWSGWLVTLMQGLGLLLVITWLFGRGVARFGVLPGLDVWREFSALAEKGSDVINSEAAPIPVTHGVQFLVVIGVALIAWAVDATAVTWRQATIAGIPLLTLYLVPAIVLPHGVPWPLFLLAGAGWLVLLLTDGRRELTRWGRPIDDQGSSRLHSVGGTGRRLGAAALTVAVIVPVILPSLDDGRFGFGTGGDGSGEGGGSADPDVDRVTTFNPITDLRRDLVLGPDTQTFTYTTNTPNPDYFRVATLDSFDGFTWRLEELGANSDDQVASGLPAPPGLTDENVLQTTATYDVSIEGLESSRLPVPYPVSVVQIDGDWRYDADTFDIFTPSDSDSSLGMHYTATQDAVTPTADQLRATGDAETAGSTLTEIPDKTEAVLGDIPFQVTEGAATHYDQALMLQNWFRTEFDYSTDNVKGNSDDALIQFLEDRSGYCEQFAATMALMARKLGIPSRVEVGYTPGEEADNGTWQVTAHDAHAWPELWFEGIGWVRFEPTPGGGDGGATPAYAPPPVDESQIGKGHGTESGPIVIRRGGGPIGGLPGRKKLPAEVLDANRNAGAFNVDGEGGASGAATPGGSRLWLLLTLIAVVAAAALAPVTAQRITRSRRWRRVSTASLAVEAAWADVLDAATDVELQADPTDTPRDLASRLPRRCRLGATATSDVRQLAEWVERLRYSGDLVALPEPTVIRTSADNIRTEMYNSLSGRDQRQVKWWPASGRRALAAAWNNIGETVADASGRFSSAVTQWLRRRRRDVVPSGPRSGS